jgi:hypothetical protein
MIAVGVRKCPGRQNNLYTAVVEEAVGLRHSVAAGKDGRARKGV